jgi:hypothetical protein
MYLDQDLVLVHISPLVQADLDHQTGQLSFRECIAVGVTQLTN